MSTQGAVDYLAGVGDTMASGPSAAATLSGDQGLPMKEASATLPPGVQAPFRQIYDLIASPSAVSTRMSSPSNSANSGNVGGSPAAAAGKYEGLFVWFFVMLFQEILDGFLQQIILTNIFLCGKDLQLPDQVGP